jgi:acyl-CoA dehydrogenase
MINQSIKSALAELPGLVSTRSELTARQQTDQAVEWMREKQLMSIVAPKKSGGADADMSSVCNLLSAVSENSGSLGLIYAMHLSQAMSLVKHSHNNAYLNAYIQELCERQYLIASATSEKGSGGDIFTSNCQLESRDGMLFVRKEIPNISYVNLADSLLLTARHHSDDKRQVLTLLRKKDAVIETGFEGSFIGMKGIYNAAYTIEGTLTPDAIFDDNFSAIARSTMTASTQIMWAAVWSGLAQSAISKSQLFIKKELKAAPETAKNMNLILSELRNKKFVLNSLIAAAISEYNNAGSGEIDLQASARFNRLKIEASEIVNVICQKALAICGLRGYALGGPYSLANEISDALSGPLMVSNFRLMTNNSSIERFVDERLELD